MTWREQLRPASFRGVAFEVLTDSATFGRRTVLHEYPFRDKPFVEDLGRRARMLRVSAIIVGSDYMARRDALIDAVEAEGAGKLVHPQFGEMQVCVIDEGITIQHSAAEGGCCRIDFGCVEAGEIRFPAASSATTTVVDTRAQSSQATLADGFVDSFSLAGLQSFGIQDAVGRAGDWLDTIQDQVSVASSVVIDPLSTLQSAITGARSTLNALLDSPADFAATTAALVSAIADAMDPRDAVALLAGLVGFGADDTVITTGTVTRKAMLANRGAFLELVRGAAATQAAVTLTEVEFSDYADAISLRDTVLTALDTVAESTLDDALYQSLSSLRAAVVSDVTARGADLARLVTLTPPMTLPALVLAYRIYGDASYDLDVVARNVATIVRPGFVPGGLPLEVAIDG